MIRQTSVVAHSRVQYSIEPPMNAGPPLCVWCLGYWTCILRAFLVPMAPLGHRCTAVSPALVQFQKLLLDCMGGQYSRCNTEKPVSKTTLSGSWYRPEGKQSIKLKKTGREALVNYEQETNIWQSVHIKMGNSNVKNKEIDICCKIRHKNYYRNTQPAFRTLCLCLCSVNKHHAAR